MHLEADNRGTEMKIWILFSFSSHTMSAMSKKYITLKLLSTRYSIISVTNQWCIAIWCRELHDLMRFLFVFFKFGTVVSVAGLRLIPVFRDNSHMKRQYI